MIVIEKYSTFREYCPMDFIGSRRPFRQVLHYKIYIACCLIFNVPGWSSVSLSDTLKETRTYPSNTHSSFYPQPYQNMRLIFIFASLISSSIAWQLNFTANPGCAPPQSGAPIAGFGSAHCIQAPLGTVSSLIFIDQLPCNCRCFHSSGILF